MGTENGSSVTVSKQTNGSGSGSNTRADGGSASFGSSSSDVTNGVSSLSGAIAAAGISVAFLGGEIRDVLDKQYDMTLLYERQTKKDFDFWEFYYAPFIKQIVQEYYGVLGGIGEGEQVYTPTFENRRGNSASKARTQCDSAWLQKWNNTPPDQVGRLRWEAVESDEQAFVMACSYDDFGVRFELARQEAFDIRRWNHRLQLANIGIDAGNIAQQGIAAALDEMGRARQGIADSMTARGAGAIRAFSAIAANRAARNNED